MTEAATAHPGERCIHELIEAQAKRTPFAIAVTLGDAHLTYGELNARANRLACRLRQIGVGPDVRVGLCTERSLAMSVGILGILKAGGAYVPLDPDYPVEHLSFVLQDAQIRAVVTEPRVMRRKLLDWTASASVVLIDSAFADPDAGETNLSAACGSRNLAYVIYTSGSTGRPKGVMVTHRNLVHSTMARVTFYRDSIDNFVLLPSFAFDASVAVIFWTLCTGGRLVLPPPGAEDDPSALCRVIAREQISHVLCVCSAYGQILERGTAAELASIRLAIVGGEACPPLLIGRHRERTTRARLFNEYGATECTVWSCACEVSGLPESEMVPIGQPIANTQIYILGSDLQPVPVGATGEIYVGGHLVALGYLNRPDLTAERFIANPFGNDPASCLFKTGDLGRYRIDGQIDYFGRIDHQVKIRGYRVEPEEIEAVLMRLATVRNAVVVAENTGHGGDRLVAYIVQHAEAAQDAREIRGYLRRKLPDFMIPTELVFVDELPLTAVGKVDRSRVPLLKLRPVRTSRVAEPLQPLEQQLLDLWELVFGVQPIGIDDNFFEIGGHSLLAVQMLTKLEVLIGRELSLTSLLHAPSIRELARLLRGTPLNAPSRSLVPIQPDGSRPPFFFVHSGNGTALSYEPLARRLGRDQPVYALQAAGLDGTHSPDCRAEEMGARYLTEIRMKQTEGPYFLGGHSFGGLVAFEMARQLEAQGERVPLLALIDTFSPAEPLATMGLEAPTSLVSRFREWVQLHLWGQLRLKPRRFEPRGLFSFRQRSAEVGRDALLATWRVYRQWLLPERPRLLRLLDDVTVANRLAHRRYVPDPYAGRVALFRANTRRTGEPDPLAGWSGIAKSIEVHQVPGDHVSLIKEPNVGILADQLKACLDQAQREPFSR